MALTTDQTFDELRDRSFKALERAGVTPDLDTASLPRRKWRSIERIYDQRAAIETLASSQDQCERYAGGCIQWHRDFVFLGRLPVASEGLPSILTTGVSPQVILDKLPNSRAKRFQQIFTRPEHIAVDMKTLELLGQGDKQKLRARLNQMPLDGLIVSADRLPNRLVESLGLIKWEERSYPLYERLQIKSGPEVIDGLKLLWESLRQLNDGSHRILVVSPPSFEVQSRYPRAPQSMKHIEGAILYVRERDGGAKEVPDGAQSPVPKLRFMVQYFASAYAAQRKMCHQRDGYDDEIKVLAGLQVDVSALSGRLDVEWRKGTPPEVKEALRQDALNCIAHVEKTLEACSNRNKKEARDSISEARELLEPPRLNPSASMTKLVKALNRVERRCIEMKNKGGFNEEDSMCLKQKVAQAERAFERMEGLITRRVGGRFDIEERLDEWSRLRQDPRHLGISGLSGLTMRPFLNFAREVDLALTKFKAAVQADDRVVANDAVARLVVVSKSFRALVCIEELKSKIMQGRAPDIGVLIGLAVTADQALNEEAPCESRVEAMGGKGYQDLRKHVADLKRGLKHYDKIGMSFEDRLAMYKRMRKYLRTFDAIQALSATELPQNPC